MSNRIEETMPERIQKIIFIGLAALLVLSACSASPATEDWKIFDIAQEPRIDIQFRLPPEWFVDYAPVVDAPGKWNVILIPPKCAPDQETEFEDHCVDLSIYLKDETDFDKQAFLAFASQNIILNQTGTEKTIMMGQNAFEVNGLTVQRYNHKLFIGELEVQMSFLFFETENAYYTLISEIPYEEREGNLAEEINLLVNSIALRD